MTIEPALRFCAHEDVVFSKAPLEVVLCQIRFPAILALLESAGVAGFQEAIRREYPEVSTDRQVEFRLDSQNAEVIQQAPVWHFRTEDSNWTVSLAVDFVALETPTYPDWREFRSRLEFVLAALDRTLSPSRAVRVGLRKVNLFSHQQVASPPDWAGLLRPELLGLAGADIPGKLKSGYSEFHLADNSKGTLTVRFGPDPGNIKGFRLDMDYWTEEFYRLVPNQPLVDKLEAYSHAMTSFFHWAMEPDLKAHLKPRARSGEARL